MLRLPPAPDRARLPRKNGHGADRTGAPLALFLDLPLAGGEAVHQRFKVTAYAKPWAVQQVYCSPAETGFELRTTLTRRATVGELVEALSPGVEGRLDRFGAIVVQLYGGALSSVAVPQMLNGANVLAVRSEAGAWEVLQFATAEEIAPSVWRLTDLLRGQLGTNDAAAAGAASGADVVLLDQAVQTAGLREGEAGLELNWRVGPAGSDFGPDVTVTESHVGGLRAGLPLSPVHLRADKQADGGFALAWIRRGRIDADSWHGTEIPQDELVENYVLRIGAPGGPTVRQVTVGTASWTYPAASLAADFPVLPSELELEVRQVGRAGEGIAGRLTFATAG